jgi:hypothetical protein
MHELFAQFALVWQLMGFGGMQLPPPPQPTPIVMQVSQSTPVVTQDAQMLTYRGGYGRSLDSDGGVGDDHGAPRVDVAYCGWSFCEPPQP